MSGRNLQNERFHVTIHHSKRIMYTDKYKYNIMTSWLSIVNFQRTKCIVITAEWKKYRNLDDEAKSCDNMTPVI